MAGGPGSEDSGGAPAVESPLAPHTATAAELQERAHATRSENPYVVLRHPERGQMLVGLGDRTHLTIGRRAECDLALEWDNRVSRLHAELVLVGGEWVVSDDGLSANGTWVGDSRLDGRRRLRDGDLVRVGNTVLAFCAPREPAVATQLTGDETGSVRITPAQRRVLTALCTPFISTGSLATPSNADLAAELFLSIDAIRTHLKALFGAFALDGVPSRQKRAELVQRAVRTGAVRIRDVADAVE